jgi:hypothetical protein
MLTCRTYEDRDESAVYDEGEGETSSIIRIRKQDTERNPNLSFHSERADTVLYLKEINKYFYPPISAVDG